MQKLTMQRLPMPLIITTSNMWDMISAVFLRGGAVVTKTQVIY